MRKLDIKTRSEVRVFGKPVAGFKQDLASKVGWLAAFSPSFLLKPSVLILIAANLLPLAGVVFWGWDLFSLMLLYWAETGIIGFFTLLHIALAGGWFALFLVPFFIVHFGGFMVGHFLFLASFFGGSSPSNRLEELPETMRTTLADDYGLLIAFAGLFVSHAVSFALNVLRPIVLHWRGRPIGAHASVLDGQKVMFAPYGRVIVMHFTIIIGAMLAVAFGSPIAAFVLLVALKTTIDLAAHVRKNFSAGD